MKNNEEKYKVVRSQTLAKNIAIVDGFSGTGKSLMMPLLSNLKHGEVWQISEETEGVCLLESLNLVDYDAAKALVKRNFDKRLYDLSISRNVNFRATDDSSIQNTLLTSKYKKRIKDKAERGEIVKRIRKNNPLLVMDAHYLFGNSDLYIKSFEDNLSVYIFMLRNPAHLVNAYFNQNLLSRIGKDPMEIQLCVEIDDQVVPYYVAKYFDEYKECKNNLEKVILIVFKYYQKVYDMYNTLNKKEKEKFHFISFENFSENPEYFITKICDMLGTKRGKSYDKIYNHLQMPRKNKKQQYNQTFKLAKELNLTIRKKYKTMLKTLINEHKTFIKNEKSKIKL